MGEHVDFRAFAADIRTDPDISRVEAPDMPQEQYGYPAFADAAAAGHDAVSYTGQGSSTTVRPDDDRPIAATDGLATCIGYVVETADAVHVGHASSGDEEHGRIPAATDMYDECRDAADVTYVIGNRPDVDVFRTLRQTLDAGPADIATESVVYTGRSGSIAADARTGARFTYRRPRDDSGV